jgi:hypothetical protein
MQLAQIRLQSSPSTISLKTTQPIQSIEQSKAVVQLEQPPAEMNIEHRHSFLSIDQLEARSDMDLKSIGRRISDAADQGYQDWLSGLARVAQEGDNLAHIERGGHPIGEHAKQNSQSQIYDYNIAFVPSSGSVKLDYDPGELSIDWNIHKPENNSYVQPANISYTPGNVQVNLDKYASLNIDFANLVYKGINYEQEI